MISLRPGIAKFEPGTDMRLIRKHTSPQGKPFGCTFPNCEQKFGRKGDWKRHENTRHFRHQSWYCQEAITTEPVGDSDECGKIFYRQHLFVHHIRETHGIKDNDEIKKTLRNSRIGRNGQAKFWCGFCRKTISLQNQGLAAWDERFDHIDDEHFKKGRDIAEWFQPDDNDARKDQSENFPGPSSDEARSGVNEQASSQQTAARGRSTTVVGYPPSFGPVIPFLAPYRSLDPERPAKRPRTIPSRGHSPLPSERFQESSPVQPASSTSSKTRSQQPHNKSAPSGRTDKMIADSLFSQSDGTTVPEPEPTYRVCVSLPYFPFISKLRR